MLEVPRWLVWSWVKRGARWTKVPHIPGTIIHARVNDARGVSYAEARAAVMAVSQPAAGVGWRVLDDIGRVWIDADKCRDPNTGGDRAVGGGAAGLGGPRGGVSRDHAVRHRDQDHGARGGRRGRGGGAVPDAHDDGAVPEGAR